ncbi:MAG: hypothetical protein ACI4TZ_03975 [Christensenellales bacterium]
MTKKKSIMFIMFAICFMIPAMFMLSACGHSHKASAEWLSDATYHWHVCEDENCKEILDKAEHTWDAGVITTQATETTEAIKTFTCTVCEKTRTENVTKQDAGLSLSASYNPSKEYNTNYAEEPVLGEDYTCASDGAVIFAWYEKIGDTYSSEPLTDAMGLCAPYEVGTYKLVMSVAETKNYASAKIEKEGIVISPRQITLTNTNLTKVYGTSGKIDDCSFGLDEILYKVSTEEGGLYEAEGSELYLKVQMNSKNVGADILNMGFVMDGFENLNYALANANDITAEITKKEVTGNFDLSVVYSGNFGTVMAKSWETDSFYNEEFANLFVAGDKVYIYKGDVRDVTNGAKAWTNATLYGADADNYDISKLTLTYEIKHATLTFTQATLTKEYDTTSTFTYTFTTADGLKNGTTCTLTFTVKDADDNDIKNASEYTDFVVDDKNATLSNSNYKVDYSQSPIFTNNGGKLVITPKVITELDIILSARTGTSVQVSPKVSVGNTTESVLFKLTVISESEWDHAGTLTFVLGSPITGQVKIEIVSDKNYELAFNLVGTLTVTA